jgi:hypothetical protein
MDKLVQQIFMNKFIQNILFVVDVLDVVGLGPNNSK